MDINEPNFLDTISVEIDKQNHLLSNQQGLQNADDPAEIKENRAQDLNRRIVESPMLKDDYLSK